MSVHIYHKMSPHRAAQVPRPTLYVLRFCHELWNEVRVYAKQKEDGAYSPHAFNFKLALPKYSATLIFALKPSRFSCASNYIDLQRFPRSKATGA
jgi:hypothetical protein